MNKNKLSQFCPDDCLFPDFEKVCQGCAHSKDKVFANPFPVEIRCGSGFETTSIIGRNDKHLYLEDSSSVPITSRLIKDF